MAVYLASRAPRGAIDTRRPLWSSRHLAVVVALNAVGAILMAIGWVGASGSVHARNAMRWLDLGIGGLIVVGAANALHLYLGRRQVAVTRGALARELPRLTPERAADAAEQAGPDETGVVAAAGMGHFHRPGCPLAVGKELRAGSPAGFARAGLRPCEVCEP